MKAKLGLYFCRITVESWAALLAIRLVAQAVSDFGFVYPDLEKPKNRGSPSLKILAKQFLEIIEL